MGLFKKKKKKERKKLTEQQFVTRMSRIIFAVMIVVVLIIVVPKSIKDATSSITGETNILNELSAECDIGDVTTKIVSDDDIASLKNKLESAGIDVFDDGHFDTSKFKGLSACDQFSLTSAELACFANEILGVDTNYYSIYYYNVEVVTDAGMSVSCVAVANFRSLCRFSNDQLEKYKTLGYTVPNKVYLTTTTTLGEESSSSIVFNTLNKEKSDSAKSFVNDSRSNFSVESVLYQTLISALDTFCDKVNINYSFENNGVVFYHAE